MGTESEDIRQEMDETRCSLTDKISLLEQHVVETVHEATVGVKQTVEAVKDTVQSVKDTVGETVDSVKETFSIPLQVKRHPWMMLAGAAGAGLAAGFLLMAPARQMNAAQVRAPRRPGNGSHKDPSVVASSFAEPLSAASDEPSGVLHQLTQTFGNEINQLKGLAIGTLAGVVRDLVGGAIPEMMRSPVDEVFNNMTVKLGGQPVRGRIVPDSWQTKAKSDSFERADDPEKIRPQRQSSF